MYITVRAQSIPVCCVCVDICACIYTPCRVMVSTVKVVGRGMENDVLFGKKVRENLFNEVNRDETNKLEA